jgi:hypothetical protein
VGGAMQGAEQGPPEAIVKNIVAQLAYDDF